jgi:hypothetical protein
MGTFSPKAFGRAVKYADGWIGMIPGTLDDFEKAVNTIRGMAIIEDKRKRCKQKRRERIQGDSIDISKGSSRYFKLSQ